MSRRRRVRAGAAIVLLCVGLTAGRVLAARPPEYVLSGTVLDGSGRHPIYVALWNAAGFLKQPVKEERIAPGQAPHFRFEVPGGMWALSAFEDVNGNGRLDMGWFGPKEPSGFWKPFHAWRRPRFSDVAAEIRSNTADADIRLRK